MRTRRQAEGEAGVSSVSYRRSMCQIDTCDTGVYLILSLVRPPCPCTSPSIRSSAVCTCSGRSQSPAAIHQAEPGSMPGPYLVNTWSILGPIRYMRLAGRPWSCSLASFSSEPERGNVWVQGGEWKEEGGRWEVEGGRWKGGRWQMADGRWTMADGRWPMDDGWKKKGVFRWPMLDFRLALLDSLDSFGPFASFGSRSPPRNAIRT